MKNKKSRKKPKKNASKTDDDLYSELGIAREDWELHVDFNKGVLSGGRGVTVVVENLKTGSKKKLTCRCSTKSDCYLGRNSLIRDAIVQLS